MKGTLLPSLREDTTSSRDCYFKLKKMQILVSINPKYASHKWKVSAVTPSAFAAN